MPTNDHDDDHVYDHDPAQDSPLSADDPVTDPPDLNSAAPLSDDDPRLTAYALGQLNGDDLAVGRAVVEAALAAGGALAADAAAIRAFGDDLSTALSAEGERLDLGGLNETQLHRVRRAALRRSRHITITLTSPEGRFTWVAWMGSLAILTAITVLLVAPNLLMFVKGMKGASVAMVSTGANVDSVGMGGASIGDGLSAAPPAPAGAAAAPVSEIGGAAAAPRMDGDDLASSALDSSQSQPARPIDPLIRRSPSSGERLAQGHEASGNPAVGDVPPNVSDLSQISPPNPDLSYDLFATAVAPMRYPTPAPPEPYPPFNGEGYNRVVDNPFQRAADAPLSTFGIDVDTASYANVRRFLTDGQLPPPDAVRIEELVNYFPYAYDPPRERDEMPFAVDVAAHPAPWAPEHRLVRIALKGRVVDVDRRPSANLVFLIDVSGSMDEPNKLPLVQQAMSAMVDNLRRDDRVAIVTYAGSAGIALDSTPGSERGAILDGIARLTAGGSTNGAAGILTAYEIARQHFVEGGVNRVILATDGDFNVGVTGDSQLIDVITSEAKTGVFLTALGFGTGNLQDGKLEQLADKGNGHYAYIDGEREARKTLVDELEGTLVTIAKDVKIQVEFNPATVAGYRQIGYENRAMAAEDFADDTKDGGEIGAGHTVTALYEIIPAGQPLPTDDDRSDPPLRYQPTTDVDAQRGRSSTPSDELLVVKLRWKAPDGTVSTERDVPFVDRGEGLRAADPDWRFAASVAAFGMLLRQSPYRGDADWPMVLDLAEGGLGRDDGGWRHEFLNLAQHARTLAGGDR